MASVMQTVIPDENSGGVPMKPYVGLVVSVCGLYYRVRKLTKKDVVIRRISEEEAQCNLLRREETRNHD